MPSKEPEPRSLPQYLRLITKTLFRPSLKNFRASTNDPFLGDEKFVTRLAIGLLIANSLSAQLFQYYSIRISTFYLPVITEIDILVAILVVSFSFMFFVGMVNYLSRQWLGGGNHFRQFLGGLTITFLPLSLATSLFQTIAYFLGVLGIIGREAPAILIISPEAFTMGFVILSWIVNLLSIIYIYQSMRAAFTLGFGKSIFALLVSAGAAALFALFILGATRGMTRLF